MLVTWVSPEELVEHELQQSREEGRDVRRLQETWNAAKTRKLSQEELRCQAEAVLTALDEDAAAHSDDREPSQWDKLMALTPCPKASVAALPLAAETKVLEHLKGAWLGRAAGCLLGKPVEGKPRAWIRSILEVSGQWPLSDYITAAGIPPQWFEQHTWHKSSEEALRETIVCMPEDDDMNYPMVNLIVAETFGPAFTPSHVMEVWLHTLPLMATFTAERVAYINAAKLWEPPHTARIRNPYREWIGAQIRADFWGWVFPGRPQEAAAAAYKDAVISHTKNGIYGELFAAAMTAAAFTAPSIEQVISAGLDFVPQQSRLAEAVKWAIAVHGQEPDFERALDGLYQRYGDYHWVHTINNAALVVLALLYGAGDFERTICLAVMGGLDTDCNGATVGSILGARLGERGLPQKWIAPLQNCIRTSLAGLDRSSFDDLARRTLIQVQKFAGCKGVETTC